MLDLTTAVALSLLPGGTRFMAIARLRESGLLSGGQSPPLDVLVHAVAGADRPLTGVLERAASHALARAAARGIRAVAWGDVGYPAALCSIPDPPAVLWQRGGLDAIGPLAVAIVGTRACTPAARQVAGRLAEDLAHAGLVVVSGLARGVDAAAHAGAVSAGATVAVLGSGPDVIYPAEHQQLAGQVAVRGALVSEFPPGTAPRKHHFPLRNRIISGISRAVIVVEAGETSGALITARTALDQGRDVMAVPGPVLPGRNRGAHRLIKDGARLVEDVRDVLEELGVAPPAPAAPPPRPGGARDAGQGAVLAAIDADEPAELDAIVTRSGLPASHVLATLLDLEVAGAVDRLPGGRFVRSRRKW